MAELSAVEICAGAGGQALGLELAGFSHALAVELDENAVRTLRENRDWDTACGDVADPEVWKPADYAGIDLLAGGVPCPPFSIAGKQLGANDERDLFAWAVEMTKIVRPRALLLENVRGLSTDRFSAYRQLVRDRLEELGYWSDWRLLPASDFGVPQLRPRFVLVAMSHEDAAWFRWPEPGPTPETVGDALLGFMQVDGWPGAERWAEGAQDVAPTIVGGSKKHGGADLGPTRAKRAWAAMGVDGLGIADAPPSRHDAVTLKPKLTADMVARLQGWKPEPGYEWVFTGRKTSRYRQIGNAFPPPVARAVGTAIHAALVHEGSQDADRIDAEVMHDGIYRALRDIDGYATAEQLLARSGERLDLRALQRRIAHLAEDFVIEERDTARGPAYRLVDFKGFIGQEDHERHSRIRELRAQIS